MGQKTPKKLHLIKANFFWRAIILIEVIYLIFSPISWHFSFLGHPVWWKYTYTLNKYVHVFGKKGSKTAPTHNEKLFQESNYIDESHISQFLAFRKFSIFLDTLYHFLVHFRAKCHKTRLAFIFQNSKFQKDWMDSLELRAKTVIPNINWIELKSAK